MVAAQDISSLPPASATKSVTLLCMTNSNILGTVSARKFLLLGVALVRVFYHSNRKVTDTGTYSMVDTLGHHFSNHVHGPWVLKHF